LRRVPSRSHRRLLRGAPLASAAVASGAAGSVGAAASVAAAEVVERPVRDRID
jgi:hypothetical protein